MGEKGLRIDYVTPNVIEPHPKSPRRGNVKAILESIRANGTYRPIIVQLSTGYILAGSHLWRALVEDGAELVPVTYVDVDDTTASRILLADNRISDLGEYDEELLTQILGELPSLDGTGYTQSDLNTLLDAILKPGEINGDPDEAPPAPADPINKPGDIWQLGNHRLICADSCDPDTYEKLFDGEQADGMWTDPPYGVSYQGGTSDKLTIMNDGAEEAEQVVRAFLRAAVKYIRPGGPVYVCHAETQRTYLEGALADAGVLMRQALVWVKDRFVLGHSDYQNAHEPILVGEVPEKDFEHLAYGFTDGGTGRLGRGGPHWHGGNSASTVFEVAKPKSCGLHPTMKPVDLIRPMVRNSIERGEIVLDPFGGSGSTLIAAHMEGRRAYLIELDPRYADVICRRFEELTGIVPVHAGTGRETSFLGGADDGKQAAPEEG